MDTNKIDNDAINALLDAIAFHQGKLDIYKQALAIITGKEDTPVIRIHTIKIDATGNGPKIKFSEWLLAQFNDETPKLTRTLLDAYNTGREDKMPLKQFSSKVIQVLKTGIIKRHEVEDATIDKKFWYGKPAWFEGKVLKGGYLDKIQQAA